MLETIRRFDANNSTTNLEPARERLEPTLTPATYSSVRRTHVASDILTILAFIAMELRRRTLGEVLHVS